MMQCVFCPVVHTHTHPFCFHPLLWLGTMLQCVFRLSPLVVQTPTPHGLSCWGLWIVMQCVSFHGGKKHFASSPSPVERCGCLLPDETCKTMIHFQTGSEWSSSLLMNACAPAQKGWSELFSSTLCWYIVCQRLLSRPESRAQVSNGRRLVCHWPQSFPFGRLSVRKNAPEGRSASLFYVCGQLWSSILCTDAGNAERL